jgi:hypothetical protein
MAAALRGDSIFGFFLKKMENSLDTILDNHLSLSIARRAAV